MSAALDALKAAEAALEAEEAAIAATKAKDAADAVAKAATDEAAAKALPKTTDIMLGPTHTGPN